jgi:dsRNA-specific ribonuclease
VLTHPEITKLQGAKNYERFEHLGDRVLKYINAVQVFANHKDAFNHIRPEDYMTKLKAQLENNQTLNELGLGCDFRTHLHQRLWLSVLNWAPYGFHRKAAELKGVQKKMDADLMEARDAQPSTNKLTD